MSLWKDVPDDVLRCEWDAALAAEVGGDLLHTDLGRRLVQLAAEMDRRILAGHRNLLRPADGPTTRRSTVPAPWSDAAWLTAYITRAAAASTARVVDGDVRGALTGTRQLAVSRRRPAGDADLTNPLAAATPEPGASTA